MVKLIKEGVYLKGGRDFVPAEGMPCACEARRNTIAYSILSAHNSGDEKNLKIKFDALASHDITYVGILLTARAGGLEKLPVPYVLTNCHNSLCAVGGTINEDDHMFGLSAAKKYGGIYVPAHMAVIHAFMREMMSGCGKMILGSDSHTRYGALGTMAIGEGGPEIVKQLLSRTYDVAAPGVIAVRLTGAPRPGVGPQDVALAIIGATFASGFVKNKVLEFVGDGIANLPMEFRNGIDVMTTETTCLSSIWMTDSLTEEYFTIHGRPEAYKKLAPGDIAYYDGAVDVDLSKIEPMIALPFHPSNTYTIRELNQNAGDILRQCELKGEETLGLPKGSLKLSGKVDRATGRVIADQGVIAGCAGGTFDNLCAAADILRGGSTGAGEFALSAYPASQPVMTHLMRTGVAADLLSSGVTLRTAFCGPCFGAGDVPANNGLSLRHTTRNFPNREGSKPGEGQISGVALMDARSIAATAANGGIITAATDIDYDFEPHEYHFDKSVYSKRVYYGYGKADKDAELILGPNITDWPAQYELSDNLLVKITAVIHDPVTTTDELIPSGETSSYRSNPLRLSEFALSRRVPEYVGRCKEVAKTEADRRNGGNTDEIAAVLSKLGRENEIENTQFGSCVFANKPGDGSAREQAASCQKVLGGFANICYEFATKRYRSNCINWGILPFTLDADAKFDYECGDYVFVGGIRKAIIEGKEEFDATVIRADGSTEALKLYVKGLTPDEKEIILDGCLMNYYRSHSK